MGRRDEEIVEGISIGEKIEFDFKNPGSGKVVDIKIELPDAVSPESLGQSSDVRALALGIRTIRFTES